MIKTVITTLCRVGGLDSLPDESTAMDAESYLFLPLYNTDSPNDGTIVNLLKP